MANNRKANDALWMAILQMLQGGDQNESAAVAAAGMSDIKKDGSDQGDIYNIVANTMFAQKNDPLAFIKHIFEEHPEMLEELEEYIEAKGIEINTPEELFEAIRMFLHEVRGYAKGGQIDNSLGIVDVTINDKVYHLIHLVSDDEKENGLMEVTSLDDDEGALFDYSNSPEPELSFWMKNTHIPLLICFINEEGKVISVHEGVPDTEDPIEESSEFISYVIEVNSGENIKPGDQTSLGSEEEQDDFEAYPDLKVNKLVIYGSDGQPQGYLQGGERIFSRIATRKIIAKAKKAYSTKEDKDYKALGRFIFKEMRAQDNREPEYIEN